MDCVIRKAGLLDIASVRGIYAHYVRETTASFELDVPDLAEMERRYWSVMEMGLPYLVAEVDGKVAGFAMAGVFRMRPAYRHTVESSVYVQAEMTGRGIGRRLLEELVEQCGASGYRQIVAAIGGQNPASEAVHAKAGFRHAGTLYKVGYKFGGWHDLVLMQREAGAGGSEEA